jgi:hypothetical protein
MLNQSGGGFEATEQAGRLRSRQELVVQCFFSALSANSARKNSLAELAKIAEKKHEIICV